MPPGLGGVPMKGQISLRILLRTVGIRQCPPVPPCSISLGKRRQVSTGMRPGLFSSRYPMWSGGLRAWIPNLPWKCPGTACLEV